MSDNLEYQISKLRKTIFNMLNYANMYVVVLNEDMIIKYANTSLARDLGFQIYKDILGKCWIDFLPENEIKETKTIHKIISDGKDWERYREHRNHIQPINGNPIQVHWFNSHINSEFNWSFSFGITKSPNPTTVTMESIRNYYKDIVEKDRTMIESIRDTITTKEKLNDACEPIMI
jgi:hypothetical protein